MKKNQNGFSIVEILVVIVVIGLIGTAGWFVLNNQKDKDINNDTSTQTSWEQKGSQPNSSDDTYVDWELYTSTSDGFKVKHPKDWAVTINNVDGDSQKESVSFKAPNDFQFYFDVYKLNSNSSFGCTGCSFKGVTQLNDTEYGKPLFVVVNSHTVNGQPHQTLSISEKSSLTAQTLKSWSYFTAKKNPGYVVRWTGEYVAPSGGAGSELLYSSYDDFIKKPEVITAQLILKSISY